MSEEAPLGKDSIATHLARTADRALSEIGNTMLKLFDDARLTDCEREFGHALRSRGIEDDARHFLGAARMKKLGLE